jgi:hypothetical protein
MPRRSRRNTAKAEKEHEGRYVYIVGRPLSIATALRVSFFSEGRFPLCHWGTLVTPLDLNVIVKRLGGFNIQPTTTSLGTLFELVRDRNKNDWRMIPDFGEDDELRTDWSVMSVAYIGRTKLSDEVIASKGIRMKQLVRTDILASDFVDRFPNYHAYTSNCQNFTLHLLRDTCADVEDCPQTIRTAVKKIMRTFDRLDSGIGPLDGPSVTITWRSINSKPPCER